MSKNPGDQKKDTNNQPQQKKESKNLLQANQKRLQQIRIKRNERLNQMQGPAGATSTTGPVMRREFSSARSECVQIPSQFVETYEKQIQCAFQTRSLDSKPTLNEQQDQDFQQVELLQPKEHRRKQQKQRRQHRDSFNYKSKQLTNQQLDSLVKSKNFNDFFNRSSKFLQKVLDHGDGNMIQLLLKDGIKQKKSQGEVLTIVSCFNDLNLTSGRVVTDIDWSTQIPQLFLAAYSQNERQNVKDHKGVVLVWTPSLKTRPQFHCFCQSAVTSAKFFPYSNSTIIGGCNNGQLLIWDFRVKAMPIMRTDVSADGHKYPVNSLSIVGTQIANNVVSFSDDGTMCLWDVKQFSRPIKDSTKFLANRPTKNTKPTVPQTIGNRTSVTSSNLLQRKQQPHAVNVTCCQFPQGDANKYFVGSLNGAMYKNAIHNTNIENIAMYDEHEGPISSISINNPSYQYQALSGLVLTSSFDWTVKLWSPTDNKESIRTFEHSDDYIYDVAWNPSNPSLFATANNQGIVDLFDLTRDMQQSTGHVKVNNFAQNKCKWNGDGSIIITGDSAGNINLLVLNQKMRRLQASKLQNFQSILPQNREQN